MRILLTVVSLLSFAVLIPAYGQSSVSKGPESTYFGNYHPKEPKSLSELPQGIRTKLENHLRERVGETFYSKLTLSGGQIVDFADLYRDEPAAKNYRWKIFTYGLTFLYAEPNKGLKAYHARILLDGDGNVMREIDLPQVAKHSDKANLISLTDARNIATKNKFPRTGTDVKISYDDELDSLVWTIEYRLKGDRYAWTERTIKIDAHSGKVLSIGNSEHSF